MNLATALQKAAAVRGRVELRCRSHPERVVRAVLAWFAELPEAKTAWRGRVYDRARQVQTYRVDRRHWIIYVKWVGLLTQLPRPEHETTIVVYASRNPAGGECVRRFAREGRNWHSVRPLRRDGAARSRQATKPPDDVAEWGARIEREPGALMAENPLQDPISIPDGWAPGMLAGRFAKPPKPFGAVLENLGDKVAQLVANIARERGRRLELAVLRCLARGQAPEEARIHTDAGGLELRVELIVAGEVAETVDLTDLHPERLMRDPVKTPA